MNSKAKQLLYISKFAAINCITAIIPYLPHALKAGATKEEIMTAYATNIPTSSLIYLLPQLQKVSDSLDDLIATAGA